jgi:peptidoglycan/LPS O-acetylase OafA/YrhL
MRIGRVSLEVVVAAAAGLCAVVVPVILDPGTTHYSAAVLPVMRDAVEGMHLYSLALLVGIGILLGPFGKAPVWLTGPATMAAFPVWSVIDMAMGQDHNLFPIEWFLYGLVSLCGLAGALAARLVCRRRSQRQSA